MHPIHDETGRFIGVLKCPDYLFDITVANLPPGQGAIQNGGSIDPEIQYFDLINTIRIRPEITAIAAPETYEIIANGQDLFILSGLPVGCTITIADDDIETDDITVTVEEDQEIGFPTSCPGIYTVKAELFPYISKSWKVMAI